MPKSWIISYGFIDRGANEARCRISLPFDSYSFTAAENYASVIAGAMKFISDAVLFEYTISVAYSNNAAIQPAETSDVTRLGVLCVSLGNGNATLLLIPSIRSDLLAQYPNSGAGILIDLELPDVVQLRALLPRLTDEYSNSMVDIIIGGIAE